MTSRSIYFFALPLAFIQACSQNVSKEIAADGIYIKTVIKDKNNIDIYIKSENNNYDCININGISGSGEKLYGEKHASLVKSEHNYGRSDILSFDNRPTEKILRIRNTYNIVKLRSEYYNFIMFPIFSCEKFKENVQHQVYIYTSGKI